MTPFEIILSSRDRSEAVTRLVATGLSRQEAKALTFGMDAIGKMQEPK